MMNVKSEAAFNSSFITPHSSFRLRLSDAEAEAETAAHRGGGACARACAAGSARVHRGHHLYDGLYVRDELNGRQARGVCARRARNENQRSGLQLADRDGGHALQHLLHEVAAEHHSTRPAAL